MQKSPTADLVEGGVSGAINVITRRPLDLRQPLTIEASVQGTYNDLSKKTEPQLSALIAWKNPENTFGVLVQGFSEKQAVRRDGQEILGYTPILATSAAAKAYPALAGVQVPTFIGASLFEQVKKRTGGAFDFEAKPSPADVVQPPIDLHAHTHPRRTLQRHPADPAGARVEQHEAQLVRPTA